MQVHEPKKEVSWSVTDFLCGLWYPAFISRRAVAQVKGVLIQVYQDCSVEKALSFLLLLGEAPT